MTDAIVIGAGPAGLMAAEMLADEGYGVLVLDAKPSLGRKFLMAGKSGLNLTKNEPFEDFVAKYEEAAEWLEPMLKDFGPGEVQAWAKDLGQEIFTGTSNRVFPKSMKASPLLRAWLGRLATKGVQSRARWRWTGWRDAALTFDTPEGPQTLEPKVTVLALGGASWARLGSDGKWAQLLAEKDIDLAPFKPSNVGFLVNWSAHMERHFGQPVKACALTSGGATVRGEFVISKAGVEGGAIYTLSKSLRSRKKLTLDLVPDLTAATVLQRLSKPRGKNSLSNHLRKTLKLDPVRLALLQEFARPLPQDTDKLTKLIKSLPVPLNGPRPIDEAISTAGGVPADALDQNLMLKRLPGVFCAGEMLDWEAPTGGYLITACLATGRKAGRGAAQYLKKL